MTINNKNNDNPFYTMLFGITIGIIISYSNLLSFITGLGLGYLSTQREFFTFVNSKIKQLT